ncbi:MAG: winged helix DNA-binding protein [Bacteroidota bacterium]
MDKKPHIGVLVRKPYLEMMKALYEKMAAEGYEGSHIMYSGIFQFIGTGKRPTELAQLSGVSKQHMKFLLNNLEQMGYLQKDKDPLDKRAVIYSLSEKGWKRKERAYEIVHEMEREWTALIGEEEMDQLRELLTKLGEQIDKIVPPS